MNKAVGYIFIIIAIATLAFVFYRNSQYSQKVRTFSPYTLLTSSWEKYKTQFLNRDGRIIDPSQNNITTSEGQSYALLRAVWADDKETFDKVWNWTKNNLKRPGDNLFGWRWGKRENNSYGFVAQGGENSASDADSDIALALILASRRWNSDTYKTQAANILTDLWTINTDVIQGKQYIVAGNWAKGQSSIIVNPSYFAPYAWKIFAEVDKKNDWKSLIGPAYEVIQTSGNLPLDKNASVGLPPDWLAIDRATGALLPTKIPNLTTNYSYDAMRIPWRISVDYVWNRDVIAKKTLEAICKKLLNDLLENGKIASSYAHNGDILNNNESPAMYGASIGCFTANNAKLASKIYDDKIVKLYSNDTNTFNSDLPYYEQNWLWFGAALYNKQIVNFK